MGRWQPDARGRLQKAALDLYAERGYEQTTVAEIAQRAGLTERTFFRHFADKREALFAGSEELQEVIVGALTDVPAEVEPFDALAVALRASGEMFRDRGPHAARRQAVVTANPILMERELIKLARLSSALTETLRARGVAERDASLMAEVGVAAFKVAFAHWVTEYESRTLAEVIDASLGALESFKSTAKQGS